jgi:PIN domain nuclease of toxin-antitoxin system
VTVLDAQAVVAYFRGEPAAGEVAELLEGPTILTSVNAAEVRDQMVGMEAGRIRSRRYHRERAAISLGDCVAASAALAGHAPLATADPALAEILRAEGGEVIPLPDSKGRRP